MKSNILSKMAMFAAAAAISATFFASCEKENEDDDNNNSGGGGTTEVGVVINGVRWATRNVDAPGTFAAKLEDAGKFYQWNRKVAYPATSKVTNWDASTPSGTEWEKANDPCPSGWRVPTVSELSSLVNSGSSWATLNGVTGRIFGSGINTVFLPAAGCRNGYDGTLYDVGACGNYWNASYVAYGLYFGSVFVFTDYSDRSYGFSVRCVAE
jgi:uncharacterized protein (TIGR02145 family)